MKKVVLYVRPMCMYCWKVMRAAQSLGMELETRNIWEDPKHQRELLEATGRTIVPVLKITDESGGLQWMPESSEIVAYLNQEFGAT